MDKLYVELGTLLQTTPEDVKSIVESKDETKGIDLIAKFKESNKVYKNEEFETYKNNAKAEHLQELQQLAKQGKLPRELHSVIKGSVLEQEQKRIAEANGITEYGTTLDELITKLVKSEPNHEKLKAELADIKNRHASIVTEYEQKLNEKTKEIDNQLLEIAKDNILKSIPLNVDSAILPKQLQMLEAVVMQNYVPVWDKESRKMLLTKDGNVVKNSKTLEPIDAVDIYIMTAKDYGFDVKEQKNGRNDDGSRNDNNNKTDKDVWIKQRIEQRGGLLTADDYVEFNKLFNKN